MIKTFKRPVFINLFKIRLPIAGILSIAHRIAGIVIFLSLPFWLYLLDLSLLSENGFHQAKDILRSNWLLPVYLVLLWSVIHHLLAGIRYLLLDMDIGIEKPFYRASALSILLAAPIITLIIMGAML